MKIGILTQPLKSNYGGLLQAFALQKVLRDNGHEVITIDRPINKLKIHIKVLSIVKRLIQSYFFNRKTVIRTWTTNAEQQIIAKHTNNFIRNYISLTKPIIPSKQMNSLKSYNFDAYIVGSDQVWRPRYSTYLPNYFLDFLSDNIDIKKIAYAASFGVDEWEFDNQQTDMARTLIAKFDAVSVRENSAVMLCNKYLACKAKHVLDPTMLLSKEDYISTLNLSDFVRNEGSLFTYILDESVNKTKIIDRVANELELTAFSSMPEYEFSKVGKSEIEKTIFPPVESWIRGFWDAEFVITDSFHGTVFSIIFNKPFIVIGNESRGLSRFTSLLKCFNLEERLITNDNSLDFSIDKLTNPKINYSEVNKKMKSEQKKAFDFINSSLSNPCLND